jgi:hypothetical protein
VVGGLVEVTPSAACPGSSASPVEQAPRTSAAASPAATRTAAPRLPAANLPTSACVGSLRRYHKYQLKRSVAVSGR